MITRTIEAWVLHKHWSGDTSSRVNFFTRELGQVQCLCKGGRTPKKQSMLQAFTPLWIVMDEKRERYYSRSIESLSPRLNLEGNALFSGLYVNELLYYALSHGDPDVELFNAYLLTLNELAAASERLSIESILRRFEWCLLKSCGQTFSLVQDHRGEPILLQAAYQFKAGEGLELSTRGIPGEHLLAMAKDNLDEAACLKSAKIIMRQAIDYLLGGREIKTRALFHQKT